MATARQLANMDEERANSLLDDLVESADMDITEDIVEESGGRSVLIDMVLR